MTVRFAAAWTLYLLWVIPAAATWWILATRNRQKRLALFVSPTMQTKLLPPSSAVRAYWQIACMTTGLLFCLLAAARPQWGTHEAIAYQQGRDVVIAIDVSRSMLARDLHPNRLERAKVDILDLIKVLDGDRAALLAFRHTSALVCPLTTDYGFLRYALDRVNIESAPAGATDIGSAIRAALDAFEEDIGNHRAIVLISDGEDLTGTAMDAAAQAAEKGIPIFTIGLGSPTGTRIPHATTPGSHVTYQGADVVSKLDNETLQAIANATRGAYVPVGMSSTANTTLGDLYHNHLARLATHDREETQQSRYVERFQYFLMPGFVLFLAAAALSRGRLASGRRTHSTPPNIPTLTHAASLLFVTMLCVGSASAQTATDQPGTTSPPSGYSGARRAQHLTGQGRYSAAAKAYLNAATGMSKKAAHTFRYNAAVALFRAGNYADAAALFLELSQSSNLASTSESMGAGSSLYRQARDALKAEDQKDPAAASETHARLLRDAGEAFKLAIRSAPDNVTGRTNLALLENELRRAESDARVARLMADHAKTPPAELADKLLKQQRSILKSIPLAYTNPAPDRIHAFEALARKQEAAADLMVPLNATLLSQMSGAVSNQQAMAQWTDHMQRTMSDSARMLKDLDPYALRAAHAAETGTYQLWKGLASPGALLEEDLLRQTNALSATSPSLLEQAQKEQAEAAELTRLFEQRFKQAFPEGATQAPAGTTNAPVLTAQDRAKILELTHHAQDAQQQATLLLANKQHKDALAVERESHDLLTEIKRLLPQQKQQKPQPQEQPKQQSQEQPQEQPEQEPTEQPKEQPQQKPTEKKELSKEELRKLIEKALEREQEYEEKKRRQNLIRRLSPTEKDW